MQQPRAAWLALGSNLGERIDYLNQGVAGLRNGGCQVVRASTVYETLPVGGPEQPHYLNAIVEVLWRESAHDLLALCQQVEAAADRVREVEWGPRTLDIDIIAITDETVADELLVVPHPRAHERAFVLIPLAELSPTVELSPFGTAGQLVHGLPPQARAGVRPTSFELQL